MNRALVSLAIVASLLTTGCATTSNGTAMSGVNSLGLQRDDFGLSRRDERTARASAHVEHRSELSNAARR
jgi:hypothetical protein